VNYSRRNLYLACISFSAYGANVVLGIRGRGRLLHPGPGLGVDLKKPTRNAREPLTDHAFDGECQRSSMHWGIDRPERPAGHGRSSPEDGAEEAAGLVGPEVAGVGFDGGGLVGVGLLVEAVGAEEDGLVGLRLAEREGQERPRRVPLRLAQRRRGHGHCLVGTRSPASARAGGRGVVAACSGR
jgi:hypothetical protein